MHPTPSRARDVTPASAESSVTASSRGLARRLSPTQTVSNAPEPSPAAVRSSRSLTVTAPRTTARLGRIKPRDGRAIRASVLLVVVADLERGAALARPPWPMRHAGWAARVHAGGERLSEREVGERARDDPDLFPEVVALHAHRGRVAAGLEIEAARVVAADRIAAQDALVEAGHVADLLAREALDVEELELGLRHGARIDGR